MKDNYFTKEEAMRILYAYEELINLDLALSNALDESGIEDEGKYKNLWNLPMVLMKYSHFNCISKLEQYNLLQKACFASTFK